MIRTLAVLLTLGTTGAAVAELAPGHGHSIRLGDVSGVVYYTTEAGDFRVVATVASGMTEPPIRFIATLAPDQQMVVSVPQSAGKESFDLTLVRIGNTIRIEEPGAKRSIGPDETAMAPAISGN